MICFEAPELIEPLQTISDKTKITKKLIAKTALREKLDDIAARLERGETVTISI